MSTVNYCTANRDRGVLRVKSKLEAAFNTGNYYEAHQMYRTLSFRLTSQKKYDECIDLLFNGSTKFVSAEQYSIGADLGILLVETLSVANVEDYLEWIDRLSKLIVNIDKNIVERDTLLVRSL